MSTVLTRGIVDIKLLGESIGLHRSLISRDNVVTILSAFGCYHSVAKFVGQGLSLDAVFLTPPSPCHPWSVSSCLLSGLYRALEAIMLMHSADRKKSAADPIYWGQRVPSPHLAVFVGAGGSPDGRASPTALDQKRRTGCHP